MKIKTELLQTMVAKSVRGASCNKMIPITGLMSIDAESGTVTLTTTNASDYLYVRERAACNPEEEFHVVVQVDVFSKLVARLTCEDVTLTLDVNKLSVFGNGNYSIELPLDEDGKLIVFPNPVKQAELVEEVALSKMNLDLIINTASSAIAKTPDIPCYTGYYMGSRVITTDTCKICGINIATFDSPVLLSSETVTLLGIFTDDVVNVKRYSSYIIFESEGCELFSRPMFSINDYQIDTIGKLLDDTFDQQCEISRTSLLQLLDRLSLFVGVYDKNEINLEFVSDGIKVSSKRANSVEVIPYTSPRVGSDTPFSCTIDIEMLTSQVKSNSADRLTIHYGKPHAIKITDGTKVAQVVALSEVN